MRRLALRSRLALLTAAAVAVAVAAAAFACWFITRDQLMEELDKSLRQPDTISFGVINNTLRQDGCHPNAPARSDAPGRFISTTTSAQVVLADGTSCWVQGHITIPVTDADRQVASQQLPDGALHTVTADGHKLRVYTAPTNIVVNGVPAAVSVARPLSDVTDPLTKLAWLLLAVAGIGVVGAATAGLWVARTGLRPVDRLTEAVEHVAATEDLNVRLPVEGEDEIARLGQSFNAMTAALASSRDRQQQLIADAGHELRTPLTSLRTNIELLERSEATGRAIPPEDRRALLASVKAQMTELAALIGDLQELSRADAAAPSLTVVPLHEIAGTALRRARLRGPGLTIGADLAPWYVRGEAAALERAIVNLLDNAVKFSPPSGAIDVALHEGRLSVRDHGPGIPAEELPHVFERFWRSPTARSLPGSGLGLSIVARTVQQAGGTVTLAPAEGGGTLATVQLPGAPTAPPETLPET
ncbi:sensor histidine kinase [Streptomyces sp. NRRL F-5123]|uniref:sensor histidine kinase n=1 Tax=Streptomyces sp. NRRL F-5123 TaxID=1463856 RepID=UPI0004E13D7D|nr:HAMP domain-containing sensor histidine kinase [Streptomyces sp. NRRL F-5123]